MSVGHNQAAQTLWLTGLSGAGKSTLALGLQRWMHAEGRACVVLDGDGLRAGLNQDLGFSDADRSENIRRTGHMCRLLNDQEVWVIAALISPLAVQRQMAQSIVGAAKFKEIYVSTSLQVCQQRDTKGLYQRAAAGQIAQMTGVGAAYEPPQAPWLSINAGAVDVDACVAQVKARAGTDLI